MKEMLLLLLMVFLLYFAVLFSYTKEVLDLHALQNRWAEIKYKTQRMDQQKNLAILVADAENARMVNNSAPYMIWEAIIRSTYAGTIEGSGALNQVRKAKKMLEQAIKADPAAMAGSAYTNLGSLYYQVPGWPVSFGNYEQAKAMLLEGLSYDPEGMDSNYFYGDFLFQQKQYLEALTAFEKALAAVPRHGRELADEGRKHEIEENIINIQSLLRKNS